MPITITISIQELLLGALILAALVAMIYIIVLIARLLPGMKALSSALEDLAHISSVAREDIDSAHTIVSNISGSVSEISKLISSNKSGVSAITHIINAAAGLAKLAKDKKDK
ncbi:MAG: hypothetical protein GX975_05135 [Clostridiales bacterium]|nr:hypothetical protein [Clostridiales bacterium]